MKTLPLALSLSLGLFCCAVNLSARIVTLTVGGTKTNDSLSIATNESFSIISGRYSGVEESVLIEKEGLLQYFRAGDFDSTVRVLPRFVIAGPATVSLVSPGSNPGIFAFITVEVQPDLFPPDKTIVVPEGSGANIILESSTNLVNWSPAPPGLYTNKTSNLFFRIRADRLP
jgi:hypothetical protein